MRNRLAIALVSAAVLFSALVSPPAMRAAGVVNTCDEAHLRAALAGGGAVTFTCSGDITLAATLGISANTTIDGTGQSVTLDGQNSVRVLSVNSGVTLSLTNLTIANGGYAFYGAGVYNSGTLIVADSTFSGNNVSGAGGGIYNSSGTAIISSSTFSSNVANGATGTLGGAIYNNGTLTINSSTFSGDSAVDGSGGGIYNQGGTLSVTNSTFSGNSANYGGAIGNSSASPTIENTIVANSPSGADCWTDFGTITDAGYNLDDDGTCGFSSANHSLSNDKNANLGSLASNGGPTQTLALNYPSDAIGVIPAGANGCATNVVADQRGMARPGSLNTNCSIGAYEYVPLATSTITDCTSDSQLQMAVNNAGRIVFACSGDIKLSKTLTISANTAIDATGYAVTLDGGGGWRVLDNFTLNQQVLILNNLTIANGIYAGGGGVYNNGALIVTNCTFFGNSAGDGGGVDNEGGKAIIANTNFSSNSATLGGAIFSTATLKLTNSTISGNTANLGGGIYQQLGTATLENTIVANSTSGSDCYAPITDAGYNLDDDGSCGFTSANHSLSNNQNANLGALSSNGGVTQTIPLLYPSLAIDAIPIGRNGCGLSADQRGVFRPQGTGCDIGSYEANQIPVPFATAPVNLAFTIGTTPYIAPAAPFLVVGGQYVITVASPQPGGTGTQYVWRSWSDSEPMSHQITVSAAASYTANFQTQYYLTTAANPTSDGSVTGAGWYNANLQAQLQATPKPGYLFTSWTGNVANPTSASTYVNMTGPQSVTANFVLGYQLTIKASPPGTGTVSPGPGLYAKGTVVKITATPNRGYTFVRWTGNVANPTSASTTVTMNQAQTVTAYFLF